MARGYSWAVAALVAATACAQDIPGVAPPIDQLHYPVGLALVPGSAPASDVLVVSNTNFDQRYNAGSVMTFPVDALVASLPASGSTDVAFVPTLPAPTSRVRVHQFGGQIAVTRRSDDPAGYARLFLPSRGKNRLTMIESTDGKLLCSTGSVDPEPALDCSAAYMVRTNGFDPFTVAVLPPAPGEAGRGLVAVGHIVAPVSTGARTAEISLVRPERFDARIMREKAGQNADGDLKDHPIFTFQESPLGGITGLAFLGTSGAAELVASGRIAAEATTPVPVTRFGVVTTNDDATNQLGEPNHLGFGLTSEIALQLQAVAGVVDMRGLAVSGDQKRAYVAVRFVDFVNHFTGGLAVVSLETPQSLSLVSVVEAGDEVGEPLVIERNGRRLVYVPDFRNDTIVILDATSDAPIVVGTIGGRQDRVTSDGTKVLAHILDAPAFMLPVERNGRQLLFVSNFSNSTIAVADISSLDPAEHRVIARFGRARNPNSPEEEAP